MPTAEWRALIRALRNHSEISGRISVRRRPMANDSGITVFDGRDYRISINSNQDEAGQVDAILHEWAHALAIEEAYKHSEPWGSMYSKVYEWWERHFTTGETP